MPPNLLVFGVVLRNLMPLWSPCFTYIFSSHLEVFKLFSCLSTLRFHSYISSWHFLFFFYELCWEVDKPFHSEHSSLNSWKCFYFFYISFLLLFFETPVFQILDLLACPSDFTCFFPLMFLSFFFLTLFFTFFIFCLIHLPQLSLCHSFTCFGLCLFESPNWKD